MGGGGSPTPAPAGPPRGGTTCGRLLVVGGTELGPFGGARPQGAFGTFVVVVVVLCCCVVVMLCCLVVVVVDVAVVAVVVAVVDVVVVLKNL